MFSRLPCCEVMKARKLGHIVRRCSPWDAPRDAEGAASAHSTHVRQGHGTRPLLLGQLCWALSSLPPVSWPWTHRARLGLASDPRLSHLSAPHVSPPRPMAPSRSTCHPAFLSLPFPFIFSPLYFFLLTTGTRTCFHEVPSAA